LVLSQNNQVEEDEKGVAMWHEWGRRGTLIDYWWESQKERDHCEDPDVGGWIILRVGWILERWDGVMWTGLVWFRIGTGGELL
jgi:hypothetical protein